MKKNTIITGILSLMLLFGSMTAMAGSPTKTIKMKAAIHCNNCKVKIEKNMAFEKGVVKVDASIETGIVTIVYKTDKNNEQALLKALQTLGYGGEIVKEEECKSECNKTKKQGCCSGK